MGNLPDDVRRPYQMQRYKNIREAGIAYLGGQCERCQATDFLEFDHIDETSKEYDLSLVWSNSKKFFQELRKCQLLCWDCHQVKSIASRSVDHGDGLSGKKNCPCTPCKARKAEYMKIRGPKYKANKK